MRRHGERIEADDEYDAIEIPPGAEAGVYAHAVVVWYTVHDFALDFCIRPGRDAPLALAVRVRIPARLMLHVVRTLTSALDSYEELHGEIPHEGQS